MKQIEYNILQGFPSSASMFKFQQEQLLEVEQLSMLGGKLFILSGCEISAGQVGAGWLVIQGEVFPFVGGTLTNNVKVVITESVTNKNFFGGASNPFYKVKTAIFGTSGNPATEWLFSDFKRNNPDNGILARLDKMEQILKPLLGYTANVGGVPTVVHGSWLFWGRPEAEIPEGWQEVTDADWRGRFPLLKDPTNVNYSTIGQLFGESQVFLQPNNIPPLNITAPIAPDGSQGGNRVYGRGGNPTGTNAEISFVNANQQPVVTMPPAKVVIFIKYVG